ncbi:unnamed protein product [Adineta ricciae]|uniref:histone deacetylase n=1 Tax=Adineta ricciae TaxID=249248 RepID=A0A814KTF0_ADIRI|nr:unnamed protein product [Adineta ricciae]CAF1317899.1 unnamed protein product [Adineta ricciae]
MNFESLAHTIDDDFDLTSDLDHGGIVIPTQTCEHVQYVELLDTIVRITPTQCVDCESTTENWLCLSCGEIHCSRYVNNHGEGHWLFTLLTDEKYNVGHCLTIGLEDLSVWCYPCKSYVKNVRLNPLIKCIESIKFGSSNDSLDQSCDCETLDNLIPTVDNHNPSTIIAIQEASLLKELTKTDLLSFCYTMKFRSASIDELVRLHSSDYVNMIVSAEKVHSKISSKRFHISWFDTALSTARLSAGMTIDLIQNVVNTDHINGFILSTSPGHRALKDHGNGTSIYNNIALGVNSVLMDKSTNNPRKSSLALIDSNNHVHMEGATPIEDAICHMINVLTPSSVFELKQPAAKIPVVTDNNNNKIQIERAFIVDLTCEHGSGIQSVYYESNQVFYLSIHKEEHQHRSSYHECGKNQGIGYTMNIPLACFDRAYDKDYETIMKELILPIVKEFQPELIVVCVDFELPHITASCYAWIIEQFRRIDQSKLVVALDGDLSNVSSKSAYVQKVLSVLIGKSSEISDDEWKNSGVNKDVLHKIDLIKQKHQHYWSCFQ